jgi:hypothetical protein
VSVNFMLWSYTVSTTAVDLSSTGPIGSPSTVVVQNLGGEYAVPVFLSASSSSSSVDTFIPGNSWFLAPGETSPLITLPSGFSLYAQTISDSTEIQISQSA